MDHYQRHAGLGWPMHAYLIYLSVRKMTQARSTPGSIRIAIYQHTSIMDGMLQEHT